jgi:RNA polymerase sigma-70 factor (ECF subfamily)
MWPESVQTQELLDRVRAGDARAVDDLLGRHREPLRRLVDFRLDPRIVRRVDASDIVQEVLVEASQRLAEYVARPAMPFHLWLRQLAKDHLISAYRKHRLARKRSVDRERHSDLPALPDRSSLELLSQLQAAGLTPAAAAIRRELEERFLGALDGLEEPAREIIVMRHVEQLSNSEAAQALGLSEPAAGMRYLRALRRLRAALGVDDEGAG